MSAPSGHIELTRAVDSITVGRRHRQDMGDLAPLIASIERHGLLQPVTITPDGHLVCGARRLAAVKQLGWRTLQVWVRSGISDQLGRMLAEQDENVLHLPLNQIEGAALYREIKAMVAEDAARRKAATQFPPGSRENPGSQGGETVSGPWTQGSGEARQQAAKMVTGRLSFMTFERVNRLQDIAADPSQPEDVRLRAAAELARIEAGGSVTAADQRMSTVLSLADLDRMAADPSQPDEVRAQAGLEAAEIRAAQADTTDADLARLAKESLARAKANAAGKGKKRPRLSVVEDSPPVIYPTRSFIAVWGDHADWWTHYDTEQIARELPDDHWTQFENTVAGTVAFADAVRAARQTIADEPTG